MATSVTPYQKLLTVGTKIIGVGRNYAAHAKELGNPLPKEPVLFMKPTSSYLENGGTIEVPEPQEALDPEVELVVVIGQRARDVPETKAMDYVGGYAVALDMTARDVQSNCKAAGLPWDIAKGRDTFTPISSVIPKSMVPDPHNLELWLKVDGELRQKGSTSDMIFKIPFLISHISSLFTLFEGDVILTGTPEGVRPVKVGQRIEAGITGLLDIHTDVGRRNKEMDAQAAGGGVNRPKNPQTTPKRNWTLHEELFLCSMLKELVANGYKSDNGLRPGTTRELQVLMLKEFPGGDFTPKNIDSRIRKWKRLYASLSTLIGKSGTGWNPEIKILDVTDEAWEAAVQKDNQIKPYRYVLLILYTDWDELFGKDRATGEGAEDFNTVDENPFPIPDEVIEGMDQTYNGDTMFTDAVNNYSVSHNGQGSESSPTTNKRRKTNSTIDTQFLAVMTNFSEGVHQRLDKFVSRIGYEHDVARKREEVYAKLDEFPELSLRSKMTVAVKLATNKELLELFMSGSVGADARKEMIDMILEGLV